MTGAPPTHAGGVVLRAGRVLLVEARGKPGEWVLPKGHIDPGETPAETAVREVAEEAGVLARVVGLLDYAEWRQGDRQLRVAYYRMEFVRAVPALEERAVAWLAPEEACTRLPWSSARELVMKATQPPADR